MGTAHIGDDSRVSRQGFLRIQYSSPIGRRRALGWTSTSILLSAQVRGNRTVSLTVHAYIHLSEL